MVAAKSPATASERYRLILAAKTYKARLGRCTDLTPDELDALGIPPVECRRTRDRRSRRTVPVRS